MRRAAPEFRPHAAGTCGKIQHGSNCLRNAGGTLLAAASSCVTDFFATFLSKGRRLLCGAVRYITQ